ncbi:MAG: PAS domain-containing protein [Alphaproteobacteria bacterium]|nr:PAS domain-containing protein [Alphaproteobacteria bacterium]
MKLWSNTAEYLSLSDLPVPAMADLLAYWRERAAEEGIPRQKNLDIEEMWPVLDNIALVDLMPVETDTLAAGINGRYVIVGDRLKKLLGKDPTGKTLTEIYPDKAAQEVSRCYRRAVVDRSPLFYKREFKILTKSFGYYRLVLPLRLKGPHVRRVLLCIFPLDSSLQDAKQWQSEVHKLERMEAKERAIAGAWAESMGYSVTMLDGPDDIEEDEDDLLINLSDKVD